MSSKKKNIKKLISICIVIIVVSCIINIIYKNINYIRTSRNDNIKLIKTGQDIRNDLNFVNYKKRKANSEISSRSKSTGGVDLINQTIGMWMNITEANDGGYCYINDLDERIAKVVDEADLYKQENLKVLFGKSKDVQKHFISTFFKAEFATLYPDLRDKDNIGKEVPKNELQGQIQIKRADKNNDVFFLEYCPYEDFQGKMNGPDVLKYFSLNEDENGEMMLVVAKMNSTIIVKQSNDEQVWNKWESEGFMTPSDVVDRDGYKETTKSIITYSPVSIAYQKLVSSYAMPFQLLWSILSVSRDKDFVMNLAHLTLDGKIVITVQDNETKVVDENKEKYDKITYNDIDNINIGENDDVVGYLNLKTINKCPPEPDEESEVKTKEGNSTMKNLVDFSSETTTTTITNTPYIDVTYANTWLIEYLNDYSYNTSDNTYGGVASDKYDDEKFVPVKEVNLTDKDVPYDDGEMVEEFKDYDGVSDLIYNYKDIDYKVYRENCLKECIDKKWNDKWVDESGDFNDDIILFFVDKLKGENKTNAKKIKGMIYEISNIDELKDNVEILAKTWSEQNTPTPAPSPSTSPIPSGLVKASLSYRISSRGETIVTPTPTPSSFTGFSDVDLGKISSFVVKVKQAYDSGSDEWLRLYLTIKIDELKLSVMEKRVTIETTNEQRITSNIYSHGIPEVREKIEERPETGEENFITLFNSSDYAKINLGTANKWLFNFLAEHETTANMVDIMKWLLGKATGIEELQGIIIDWLGLISNNSYSNFSSTSGLEGYLIQFEHGTSSAPTDETGEFYKMYGDGHGWATIGPGLCWKYQYDRFENKIGKVKTHGRVEENKEIASWVNGMLGKSDAELSDEEIAALDINIERSVVDAVSQEVREWWFDRIKSLLDEISSSLSRQQLFALTGLGYGRRHVGRGYW